MRNDALNATQHDGSKAAGSAVLNDQARRFIVQSLACFIAPSRIVEDVKEIYGVEVSRQRVQCYDPTKTSGKKLSAQWRELFASTRALYLASVRDVGIANQRYRLESLQKELERSVAMGNSRMVMAILKQAALEVGGRFSKAGHARLEAEQARLFLAQLLNIPPDEMPPASPPPPVKRRAHRP